MVVCSQAKRCKSDPTWGWYCEDVTSRDRGCIFRPACWGETTYVEIDCNECEWQDICPNPLAKTYPMKEEEIINV